MSNEIQRNLNGFRKTKTLSDVCLKIGDKHFDAHRLQLSAASPVLQALVSENWSTGKVCELSSETVDPEIGEILINYIYTGEIELSLENVLPLCLAAHFLQMQTLLGRVETFLCKTVTPKKALELFQFAFRYELNNLMNSCVTVIILYQEFELTKLPDNYDEHETFKLLECLGGKSRGYKLREILYQFMIEWTLQNQGERIDRLPQLMRSIRLDKMNPDFLKNTVSKSELIRQSIPCCGLLIDGLCQPPNTDNNILPNGFIRREGYAERKAEYDAKMADMIFNWIQSSRRFTRSQVD